MPYVENSSIRSAAAYMAKMHLKTMSGHNLETGVTACGTCGLGKDKSFMDAIHKARVPDTMEADASDYYDNMATGPCRQVVEGVLDAIAHVVQNCYANYQETEPGFAIFPIRGDCSRGSALDVLMGVPSEPPPEKSIRVSLDEEV